MLLDRRNAQGLGGAQVSWLAWQLGALKPDVAAAIETDKRFDRIVCGTDVWWWSAAALEQRNKRPNQAPRARI